MTLQLVRFAFMPDRTVGHLTYGQYSWWTIENPWQDNQKNVSCIPSGQYPLRRHNSPRFGARSWEIYNVPNRTYILFHVANTASDVEGCIGLGESVRQNLMSVGPSRPAIEEFYELTKDLDELEINIIPGPVGVFNAG